MHTPWIEARQLARALQRNEAFWRHELDDGPLLWVAVPGARPGLPAPSLPTDERNLWTDVDYVLHSTESLLSSTHYAGDALPVFCPWLGPDQFAAWLGADLDLKPRDNTSWAHPFVEDWDQYPEWRIDPANRWWRIYLEMLRRAVEYGRDKWITGYPDLHTGIDALSALRGPENLCIDLMACPDKVKAAMRQMTRLWKEIVDLVGDVVLPGGQGTSNWTMGWSESRFVCVGQNDFSCMISPAMFVEFCLEDTVECAAHVDRTIYHLDGPGALRHLPMLLDIEKIDCVQWIQGAGNPPPSQWLDVLRSIQRAGKTVQLFYGPGHGDDCDHLREIEVLCSELNASRLFIWMILDSVEQAQAVVQRARQMAAADAH